jgi:hypothetical protein
VSRRADFRYYWRDFVGFESPSLRQFDSGLQSGSNRRASGIVSKAIGGHISLAMKKRFLRVLLAVAAGGVAIVGGIWLLSLSLGNNYDTLYGGKPAGYWLDQINSQDAAASNQASAVLNLQIIPGLTDAMVHDTNDSRLRLSLINNFNRLPGVTIYYSLSHDRRMAAAIELGEFGPAATAAIPELVRMVKGNNVFSRRLAIDALGDIHSEPDVVIPLLVPYLDDDNMNEAAASALGKYGSAAKAAVPKLIPLLKINDPEMQEVVRAALRNIDPGALNQAGVK